MDTTMKLTSLFLACLSLLMPWNFCPTMVSGKKDSQHRLLGSHKPFHKNIYRNTNLRYHSREIPKFSNTGKTFPTEKARSWLANKRSFVAASPFRETQTDRGWNLGQIPDHLNVSNSKDASDVFDTRDVELVDRADGDEAVEITSGPEEEQGTISMTGRHSTEKQGRRQQIESDADISDQDASQNEHDQGKNEEYIEIEKPPSSNIAERDSGNIEPGATKPVEYGTGLSRDSTLTDEAQSDYQSAQLSMAEGAKNDSELFHDELDGVLGALLKSDSAVGSRKAMDHHQKLNEKRPSHVLQSSDEGDSGMSSDKTSTHSLDNSITSIDEIVTETEGRTSDKAEQSHLQRTIGSVWENTASSNNKASSYFHTNMKGIAGNEKHQTSLETFREIHKGSHNTAPVAEEAENPDDVNETDIEEIDDANNKLADGDISLLDQPSQPVKISPTKRRNNERVEGAVEVLHEAKEQRIKRKQSHRDEHNSDDGLSEKKDNASKNVKNIRNKPESPPRSEADQTKQFTGVPAEACSNGTTSEEQQVQVITPLAHQGSSLAKLLTKVNRQAANVRESGNVDGRVSKLSAAILDRQFKSRFSNQQLGTQTHSAITSVFNKSLGLLMHNMLLYYFKNESALHKILKSKKNATRHPLANSNLNSSSVDKSLSHVAQLFGSHNSDIGPKKVQSQGKTGFIEKGRNGLTRQGIITEAENTSQAHLSAAISNYNKNNTNNDNEPITNNTEELAVYMDPAPSTESSRTSQAIKKQELNGSAEEIILVLKNKTFGILIGRRKNSTVRLLSTPTKVAPNSVGEQLTEISSPNSGGKYVAAQSAPNSNGEQAAAVENDASALTLPKMDIKMGTNKLKNAEPQNVKPLDRLDMNTSPQNVGLANASSSKDELSGSAKSQVDERVSYIKDLKSLEIVLSRDFMSEWMYGQKSLGDLGISHAMLNAGVASLGTSKRLERVFRKALRGSDINLLVIAGSVSAGAGLEADQKNLAGVYYKAFVNWWYRSITPITASKLKVNPVAIGGTDSEYFSYCIKNHIDRDPDIVIWELAVNDYRRYEERSFPPAKPLEQLTRLILSLPSHPALVFVNFFSKLSYKTTAEQDCPNSEDEGGQTVAKYYGVPSLSWRNVVCPEIGKNYATMSINDLFSSDGHHPSITGHAQMASLLITYMKSVFEKTITLEREEENELPNIKNELGSERFSLPQPLYNDSVSSSPMCWTKLTSDYTSEVRNTLPGMGFISVDGFQLMNISHWPIRLDRQRCLRALNQNASLKIKFIVPPLQTLNKANGLNASGARKVVIFSHNSFGGDTTAWVDENYGEVIAAQKSGQRRTQADILNASVLPGLHTLTIQGRERGFCLSAVAAS